MTAEGQRQVAVDGVPTFPGFMVSVLDYKRCNAPGGGVFHAADVERGRISG
jgi:hypothetical protein